MKVKLVKKLDEAKDTKSFFFEPSEKVNWQAGQYFYITLPKLDYPDERGDTRHFTISSSSTEGGLIRITTRLRQESGFKKTLDELPLETELEGKGPNGLFALPEKIKPGSKHVYLAGGIGITPFRSMIKYVADKNMNLPAYLVYSNSDSEFVFRNELDQWLQELTNLKIEYVNTSTDGRIDKTKLENLFSKWNLSFQTPPTFWVTGPPPFVNAIDEVLNELNIPEDNREIEKFTGY